MHCLSTNVMRPGCWARWSREFCNRPVALAVPVVESRRCRAERQRACRAAAQHVFARRHLASALAAFPTQEDEASAGAHAWLGLPWPALHHPSHPTLHAMHPPLPACRKLKLSAGARAELSPLQATLGSDGRLTAERLDVRIKTGE